MRLHKFLLPAIAVASFVIPTNLGSVANADVVVQLTNDGATGALLDMGTSLADGIDPFLIPEAQTLFPGLTLAVDGTTNAASGTFNGTGGSFGVNSAGGDDSQRQDVDFEETLTFTFNQDILITQVDFSSFGDDANVLFGGVLIEGGQNIFTFDTPLAVTAGVGVDFAVSLSDTGVAGTGVDVGIEDFTIAVAVPEPSSLAVLGLLSGVAAIRRRR